MRHRRLVKLTDGAVRVPPVTARAVATPVLLVLVLAGVAGCSSSAGTSAAAATATATAPTGTTATTSTSSPTAPVTAGAVTSSDGSLVLTLPPGFVETTGQVASFATGTGAHVVLAVTAQSPVGGYRANLVVTTVPADGMTAAQGLAQIRAVWVDRQVAVADAPSRSIAGQAAAGITFDFSQGSMSVRQSQYLVVRGLTAYVFSLSASTAGESAAAPAFAALLASVRPA